MPCLRASHVLIVLAALVAGGSAEAACGDPKWQAVAVSQALEAAAPAGDTGEHGRDASGALRVTLTPFAATALPFPPERPAKNADSFAAALQFAGGAAGAYRVALSDAAWIDVVQDGKYLTPADFTGIHDCPALAVRKIVEFDIGAAPFTLQLSDATIASIAVAIVPAE